ncbi:hypothetical protein AB5I41_14965 [Sphingomonas sp. MMS24-JH45]
MIVNGRVALDQIEVAGSRAVIALWGRNLLDNKDIVQTTSLGFANVVQYERARTYGVDLTFEF